MDLQDEEYERRRADNDLQRELDRLKDVVQELKHIVTELTTNLSKHIQRDD